jgi:hypothetical protein
MVIDLAIAGIVMGGGGGGALVNDATVEATLEKGVKFVGTSWTNWIGAGARGFMAKVNAKAPGGAARRGKRQ